MLIKKNTLSILKILVVIFLLPVAHLSALAQNAKICLFVPETFVSDAIRKEFKSEGYTNVIDDAVQLNELAEYFSSVKPDIVIVDGSGLATIDKQLEYESKVISYAFANHVDRLLLLSSYDIYTQRAHPLSESLLSEKALHAASNPYAVAKLSGLSKCRSLNDPEKPKFMLCIYPMLYGKNDPKCAPKTAHPLYQIIDRIATADRENRKFTVITNDGSALYDVLHVDDFAKAVVQVVQGPYQYEIVNVSSGIDHSVKTFTSLVKRSSDYTGEVILDVNCYDAVQRRVLDNRRIQELGWTPTILLQEGLQDTYKWYRK